MRVFEKARLRRLTDGFLYPVTFLIDEHIIWFQTVEVNGLFTYDRNTGEVSFVCEIPDEDKQQGALFGEMVKIGDKLILAPHKAKRIGIYDIKGGVYTAIDFNTTSGELPFFLCEAYGNQVFFFPFRSSEMLALDIEEKSIRKLSVPAQLFDTEQLDHELPYFFRYDKCVVGTKVYLPYGNSNKIAEFDMTTCEFKMYCLADDSYKIDSICYDGFSFWLGEHDRPVIIKWNKENNNMIIYDDNQFCIQDKENGFHTAAYCEGTAYFWHYSDRLVEINTSTGQWKMIPLSSGKSSMPHNYSTMQVQADQVLAFTSPDKNGYMIDSRTGRITKFKLKMPSEREDDLKRIEYWKNKRIDFLGEREEYKLEDYLDLISHLDILEGTAAAALKQKRETCGMAGRDILEATL